MDLETDMTLSPELLAMIKDVKPASDKEIAVVVSNLDHYNEHPLILALIARIVAERKVLTTIQRYNMSEAAQNKTFNDMIKYEDIRAALSALERKS
jgi:hypothetical protein